MRKLSGVAIVMAICLALLYGNAFGRGFGGFHASVGGFHPGYGGFHGSVNEFHAGYGVQRDIGYRGGYYDRYRRPVYVGGAYYAGGWGVDESDEPVNDNDYDDDQW